MFFLIIPYVYPKLFTLFSIWFFISDISCTIHLLINSFLILDTHFVDLILVHALLISLQLCSFAISSALLCFSSSITVLIPFFFVLYFLSFFVIVPHIFLYSLSFLFGDAQRCLRVS